jgi:hypothetical protein
MRGQPGFGLTGKGEKKNPQKQVSTPDFNDAKERETEREREKEQ